MEDSYEEGTGHMPEKVGRPARPERVALQTFAAAIVLGAILLALPISGSRGQWTDPLTALFTATSATCVTGLTVVDTGSYFSRFGQIVILVLMQFGGLGIMALGTFLLIIVGRRLSMNEQILLMDAMGTQQAFGLRSLVFRAVSFAALLELAGASLLAWRLIRRQELPVYEAMYSGVFHAISAFCNAGFSLQKDSLQSWSDDPVAIGIITVLIVLGGLGFLVLHNINSVRFWRRDRIRRGRLSLHTKLVLRMTLLLVLVGWIAFVLLEWSQTLRDLRLNQKLLVSLFHSVTPRTAGFNIVDMGAVTPGTLFVTIFLMFVGGAPSSTAGGIKVTTAAVLGLVTANLFRGRQDIQFQYRTISDRVVREALAIFMLSLSCIAIFFLFLLVTEGGSPLGGSLPRTDQLLFEVVSAFGTVGLSTGVTPALSLAGKLAIIVLMFVGRLGPLTIALVVGQEEVQQRVRYPEEEVIVG